MSPMSNPQPSVAVPVDLLSAILNDASTAAGLVSHARAQAIEGRVKQAEALLSAPQGPAEKLWCAMCGKWGDHGSGSCPELRLTKRVRELEAAIREHMPASEGLRAYASDEDRKLWAAVE